MKLLSDEKLIKGMKLKKDITKSTLQTVKWVWDHSNKSLKESKQFYDDHI